MRRRLTVAMVLMVLGSLVLSGLVSLALAVRSSQSQTRHELLREAQGLAVSVQQQAETANPSDPAKSLRALLLALRAPLSLDGSAVLAVRPGGVLFDPATPRLPAQLPTGLQPSDLQPDSLLALTTVSGTRNGLVFAAVPYRAEVNILGVPRQVTQVVVLTRRPPSALAAAGPWFAFSALAILLVAGMVAYRLGRRFVRPIQTAEEVTSRIAAGDLGARVPDPPGTDPELAALAGSINSMAAGLAQAKNAERQFLQSVSHDLRTPLTSIRGFAEAIEDGVAADVAAAAGVIASEARRLERLVGDLLGLATLEARRFTLQMQPVELEAAIGVIVAGFVPTASEMDLALVVDSATSTSDRPEEEGAGWVMADPDRLAQLTANLIENALRYAAHEVRVTARRGHGTSELWVMDDGPGIPPDDLGRVFERLFVARPRRDRPVGSGLGLAIVAELAAAMGGTVRAESPVNPGGGTRMVVTLRGAAVAAQPSVADHPNASDHTNGRVAKRAPSTEAESTPTTRSSTVA
jgi:signal transduction histidine kinase